MAKRIPVEQRMADFKRASEELSGEQLLSAVKTGLSDNSNLVVEMAAKAVLELEPGDCRKELVSAWHRFVQDDESNDNKCRAKISIVEALNKLGFDDPQFYLAGMKYVQMEPAYGAPGGYEDTAAHVRGTCAYGLIDLPLASQNETLFALVDLLHDAEAVAREHAAHALGSTGLMAAAPVLRTKVLSGDRSSEVIGACFSGLMQYREGGSLEFVARFLDSSNIDIAIEAALALGESRMEDAVKRLIARCNKTPSMDLRKSLLMSLGLSRLPSAVDFLIGLIEKKDVHAETVVRSLAVTRFDEAVADRVREAVAAAKDRKLSQVLRDQFG